MLQVWSAELADVAQNYAEQCIFEHNTDRTSQQSTFTYVGENLAITSSPSVNYTSLVRNWFDERDDYNYESNTCAGGAVCGHYTQVNIECVAIFPCHNFSVSVLKPVAC